jgi:hypothetical protein
MRDDPAGWKTLRCGSKAAVAVLTWSVTVWPIVPANVTAPARPTGLPTGTVTAPPEALSDPALAAWDKVTVAEPSPDNGRMSTW